MKLIDFLNTAIVCIIFAALSASLLYTVASYDTTQVQKGIIQVIERPGSNFK